MMPCLEQLLLRENSNLNLCTIVLCQEVRGMGGKKTFSAID